MKKLMICSAALVAAVLAQAVDVPSENVIGVTVKTAPKGKLMVVAAPYVDVGGCAVAVDKLVDARTLAEGDGVRVWTGNGYSIFKKDDNGNLAAENSETETQTTLPGASGFVFAPVGTSGNQTLRLIGEVPKAPLTTTIAAGAQTLCSNPLSVSFDLASFTPASDATVKIADSAQELVWDAKAKTWYKVVIGSKTITFFGKTQTVGTRTNVAAAAADLAIPAGAAFWCSVSTGSATISWE